MKLSTLRPCPLIFGLMLASSLAAQEPRFSPFGAGCPGTFGTPALGSLGGDLPRVGDTFSVEITNLAPSGYAVGILGLMEPLAPGLTLPLDGIASGAPGCTLYTSVRYQEGLLISGGRAIWDLHVPGDPALMGFSFLQQALVLDPAANDLGWILSNAGQAVIGDRPDLVVTSGVPTASPRTIHPGGWVDVSSFTMKNESFYVSSGAFESGWLLGGTLLARTATRLYTRSEAGLAPRESRIVPARSVRIPVGTPPGIYGLGPYVDIQNQVAEWAEFPNFNTVTITVAEPLTPLPDLTFPDGTPTAAPTSLFPGDTLEIKSFRIANQGNYPATKFSTGIYLSSELTDIKGGELLGSFSIGGLVQGLPVNVAARSVVIPADTAPGNYWLGFGVDNQSEVSELDETNNLVARLITVRPIPTPPDLFISGRVDVLDPVLRPFPGLPIPVWLHVFNVGNQGGTASGPFRMGIYFSHDEVITTADERMYTVDVASLDPGEFRSYTDIKTFIPWHTPPGAWHIGAIVDDTNVVVESNENNNAAGDMFVLF